MTQLYIWKLERQDDTFGLYNIYDSFILVSESLEKVQQWSENEKEINENNKRYTCWTSLDNIKITQLGIANLNLKEGELLCASYNAG
jgi:hypothetical protein